MVYPDSNTVTVGDLIWWNEGSCVGYVQSVADSEEEFEAWGLDRSHLFLANVHPFDPHEKSGVAYDQGCLADEGIALLSSEEQADLERAVAEAGIGNRIFRVFADIHYGKMTHWRFGSYPPNPASPPIRIPIITPLMQQ